MTPKELEMCQRHLADLRNTRVQYAGVLHALERPINHREILAAFVQAYHDGIFPNWEIPTKGAIVALEQLAGHLDDKIKGIRGWLEDHGVTGLDEV